MSEYSDPRNVPDDPTNVEVPAPEDQPGYAEPLEGEKPHRAPNAGEVPAPEDQPGYAPPDPPKPPEPAPTDVGKQETPKAEPSKVEKK